MLYAGHYGAGNLGADARVGWRGRKSGEQEEGRDGALGSGGWGGGGRSSGAGSIVRHITLLCAAAPRMRD